MGILIGLIVSIAILFILGIIGLIRHRSTVEEIDKEIFKYRGISFIGIFILEDLLQGKYKIWFKRLFNKTKDLYTQLYGKQDADAYTDHHFYYNFSISCITLFIALIVTLAFYVNTITNKPIKVQLDVIERPAYGELSEEKTYQVIINDSGVVYEEEVIFEVEGAKPSSEDVGKGFEELKERINVFLDGKLTDEGYLAESISLPTSSDRYEAKIVWTSSEPTVLTNKGVIIQKNIVENEVAVTLSARLIIDNEVSDYSRAITVKPAKLSNDYVVDMAVNSVVESLKDENSNAIKLPKEFIVSGSQLSLDWYETIIDSQSNSNYVLVFVMGVALSIALGFIRNSQMQEKLKKKSQSIQMDFPVFADKFILYINCGMVPEQALVKYLSKDSKKSPLNSELKQTLKEIEYYGVDQREAFLSFGKRTRVPEVLKFSTLVAQMIKKGDEDIQISLHKLIAESWEQKRRLVLEEGNKASTKLLIPMMIMMLLVVLVVLAPASITFSNI